MPELRAPEVRSAEAERGAEVAPPNTLTVWARLIVETLVQGGLREVVASPGSRSTPLLLAAVRHPELTVRTVIDERAAAFVALAQARVTERATALLCTSGSAPAHYFPAVIEASEAGVPLLVLSADRPRELVASGAPQSTDQVGLYGPHVRAAFDLSEPDADPRALRGARRVVATALSRCHGPRPGPVHLNVRARKPLEPCEAATDTTRELDALGRALAERSPAIPAPRLGAPDLSGWVEAIQSALRPAIVAGPLPLSARALRATIGRLVADKGLCLLAESSSQLRFDGTEAAGRAARFNEWIGHAPDADPDLVVEIGATPTSAAYARFAATGRVRRFVLADRPRDPQGTAEAIAVGDLRAGLEELLAELPDRASGRAGIDAAERAAKARVEACTAPWSEGRVVSRLLASMPAGALLSLANSGPIRHVDRFGDPDAADLRVVAQRGVNGIDGLIAGAVGLARADGGVVAALLGDVACAHDLGSLALLPGVDSPLALVVIDNDGGRIFDTLPIAHAGLSPSERALFTTPPKLDLAAIARAHSIPTLEPSDAASLDAALETALGRPGATLIVCRVDPDDAAQVADALRRPSA